MKNALVVICLSLLVPAHGFSQEHYDEERDVMHLIRLMPNDRLILHLGMCSWMEVPEKVKLSPFSIGYGGHWYWEMLDAQNNVNLAIGLGLDWRRFSLNSFYHHHPPSDSAFFAPYPDSLKVETYRHSTMLAEIPFELRFKTNPNIYNRSWRFTLGFKVGWALTDHETYIGKDRHLPVDRAEGVNIKKYNMKNLQHLNYGTYVRIAYSVYGLYFSYSLSPFFEAGKGTPITPISFGLNLFLFQ